MSPYPTIDLASLAESAREATLAADPSIETLQHASVAALVVTATLLAFASIAHLRGSTKAARVIAAVGIIGVLATCALALPARDRFDAEIPTLAETCADAWDIELIAADGTVDSGRIDAAGDPITMVADLAPMSFEARWYEGGDVRFGRLVLSEAGELALEAYPTNP